MTPEGTGGVGPTATSDQRAVIKALLGPAELTTEELWLRYFELGGTAGPLELEGFLEGVVELPAVERDMVAHAVNERVVELIGTLRAPYSRLLHPPLLTTGPLAALVSMLEAAHLAAAGRFPEAVMQAAARLSAQAVVYLADYEQQLLIPVPPMTGEDLTPLSIEGTLPGRAFRLGVTQPAHTDPQPRLWIPLIDGTERLGVLDLRFDDRDDVRDPRVRQQAGWLATLVAHLLAVADTTGDTVTQVRSTRRRTAAGELVWSLLPPLTASTEAFTLSGLLEPAYDIGGDAFDYALTADRVQLGIFDSMGHALDAGLITAATLAGYRSARRAGATLDLQATAIDEALTEHFPDAFTTGVLAELDLTNGRLRYLIAGHPPPLLLREGRVIGDVDSTVRPPFGIPRGESGIKEITLQPGDWLLLYTDGVTEARDAAGVFFGVQRLITFLEREAASAHAPPETVRRLAHAVLEHQEGVLQDDATLLLASWQPTPATPLPGDL